MSLPTLDASAPPIERARAAFAEGRFQDMQALAQQAVDKARDEAEAAAAGALLCTAYFRMEKMHELAAAGPAVLDKLERLGRTHEQFELSRFMAFACGHLDQHAKALVYADRTERLALELGGDRPMMLARCAMAVCYFAMGNPWQAERLLEGAMALPSARQPQRETAVVLGNLGGARVQMFRLLREAGNHDGALDAIRRALDTHEECRSMAQEIGDLSLLASAELNLAEVCLNLGRYEQTAEHLERAASLTGQLNSPVRFNRLRVAADLELARGNTDAAISLAEEILPLWDQHPLKRFVHATLRDAYRQRGDIERALMHSEAAHKLDMQRLTVQLRAQSEYLVTRLEMEEAQRRAEGAESEARAQRELADAMEVAAHCDPLTGLGNRRLLDKVLGSALTVASQRQRPLSVVVADLDHFKKINDCHGHGVGDEVLVAIAQLLRSNVREADPVARVGGEEFVLVLSDADERRALELCERIRTTIEGHDWSAIKPGLAVTISIGFVTRVLSSGVSCTQDELLDTADKALYAAKAAGRNRVVCASLAPAADARPAGQRGAADSAVSSSLQP